MATNESVWVQIADEGIEIVDLREYLPEHLAAHFIALDIKFVMYAKRKRVKSSGPQMLWGGNSRLKTRALSDREMLFRGIYTNIARHL